MPEDLAAPLKRAMEGEPDVVFAYLFGSAGAGLAGPRSDVDVAVWMSETPTFERRLDLQGVLCAALHRDDVDLVVLNDAPPALAFEGLKGQLLLSRDEGTRVVEEARIMALWRDWSYYYRRHLGWATERIRERGYA